MPEPPDLPPEYVSPEDLVRRLGVFRAQYQLGILSPRDFREILRLFQFPDDAGRIWSPGGTTNRWYCWDGVQWTAADPPWRLQLPEFPPQVEQAFTRPLPPPAAPPPPSPRRPPPPRPESASPRAVPPPPPAAGIVMCPQCGARVPGAQRFCTACGARVRP